MKTKPTVALTGDTVHFWCVRHDQYAAEDWLYQVLDGTYSVAELRAAILADRDPVPKKVLDGTYSVAELHAAILADRDPVPKKG